MFTDRNNSDLVRTGTSEWHPTAPAVSSNVVCQRLSMSVVILGDSCSLISCFSFIHPLLVCRLALLYICMYVYIYGTTLYPVLVDVVHSEFTRLCLIEQRVHPVEKQANLLDSFYPITNSVDSLTLECLPVLYASLFIYIHIYLHVPCSWIHIYRRLYTLYPLLSVIKLLSCGIRETSLILW